MKLRVTVGFKTRKQRWHLHSDWSKGSFWMSRNGNQSSNLSYNRHTTHVVTVEVKSLHPPFRICKCKMYSFYQNKRDHTKCMLFFCAQHCGHWFVSQKVLASQQRISSAHTFPILLVLALSVYFSAFRWLVC